MPNKKWFAEPALWLRVQWWTKEVTQLLEMGDVEQSRWRLKEKAFNQQYWTAKR